MFLTCMKPKKPEFVECINFNIPSCDGCLDLSNEQVYLRAKGRISQYTWLSWCAGIKAHLDRPAFSSVFNEVKDNSGFTYLERLLESEYKSDPINWFK